MELSHWQDARTWDYHIYIHITARDVETVYPVLMRRFRLECEAWARQDASIEEQLMMLQLYARILEEKIADEKTEQDTGIVNG